MEIKNKRGAPMSRNELVNGAIFIHNTHLSAEEAIIFAALAAKAGGQVLSMAANSLFKTACADVSGDRQLNTKI